MSAGELEAIRAELDSLAERLGEAAYDALRSQLHRGKPGRTDPDVVRERLLARARNSVERASALVAQAQAVAAGGAVEDVASEEEP